jgi:hypothetical protein
MSTDHPMQAQSARIIARRLFPSDVVHTMARSEHAGRIAIKARGMTLAWALEKLGKASLRRLHHQAIRSSIRVRFTAIPAAQ